MSETTFSVEDIVKEFRDYYLNSGQNLNRLKSALRQNSVTLEKFSTPILTRDTVYQMANPIFESIIQPFRKKFEPSGGVKFHPNEIRLRQIKVDLNLYPHDIEDNWLGFLAGDGSGDLKSWPITKWMMEEYIAKQVQEDKELHAVYKGKYKREGKKPEDTMDGLNEQLIKGANDPDYPIHVVHGIGELSKEKIFDQLESFDDAISELYNGKSVIHFMSPKWVKFFKRSKRANGFYFINSPNEINDGIDFTAHIVCGLPSMNGTDDIFATFKENILHLKKRGFNSANVSVQQHDREVHILGDWWEGVGFACNQLVWTTAETVNQASETSASGDAEDINLSVITDDAENLSKDSAVLIGRVAGQIDLTDTELGFVYGANENNLNLDVSAILSNGLISAELSSLTSNTEYFFRTYVKIGSNTYYGDIESFITTNAEVSGSGS